MRKYFVLLVFVFINELCFCENYDITRLTNVNFENSYIVDDSVVLYWINQCSEDFCQFTGFKGDSKYHLYYLRLISAANDTAYINSSASAGDSIVQTEIMEDIDIWFYENRLGNEGCINFKNYDNNKSCWAIYTKFENFQDGNLYDADCNFLYNISSEDNYKDVNLMMGGILFLLVFFAYAIFLPFWNCFFLVVGFIISISFVFLVNIYVQRQFILPLLLVIFTSVFFKIPFYKGKIRYVLQFIFGSIIISYFVYVQFFDLKGEVKFADGERLEVMWQQGTGLLQRCVIKNIFSDMIPVLVNSEGNEYVIYVSKYEFSDLTLGVINSDPFANLLYPLIKRPLYNLSFRESQIVLELLKKRCGVKFDFLSVDEWLYASQSKNHSPNTLEYSRVNKGSVNQFGLVNIAENVPEYTLNYYAKNLRLGLAADTIIKNYNHVIVAGSVWECIDSVNFTFVNKNLRRGNVGFRLVYRPDNIGARDFSIIGHLRSDKNHMNLPKCIKLISIDGHIIENLSSYESFEELLIESRFKDKIIEAIDLSNNEEFNFCHPKGFEYYDFEPQFYFVGL